MHFFYVDETGCNGADLHNPEQPIFVIGGLSITDEGWRTTNLAVQRVVAEAFAGELPQEFELHASQLVNGEGAFANFSRDQRNSLIHRILDTIIDRKHRFHFIAIEKLKLAEAAQGGEHAVINCAVPYLLGFNYLVTYIERYVKKILGRSARGMIILDQKEMFYEEIDRLTHFRRYEVPNARKLKWLVEFSYPVDSMRHPMVQISDLIIFLVRKFLECENGYREGWPQEAKTFYASCYAKIIARVQWSTLLPAEGPEEEQAHAILSASQATHRRQWKAHYAIA
jgi:hypothetical protein